MGIISKMKAGWQAKTTAEKINMVLDLICSIGTGAISIAAGKNLSEGHNPISRACIRISCAGLGMAAGDIASKTLQENYGKPAAMIIDKIKENKKEEQTNG